MDREAPDGAGLILGALVLVAAVANLNLSVANVALPAIGEAFDSSQTTLNLIAVGYSLGLAASVLYLGAVGDRHGRKLLLVLGMALSLPASVLAAYAPTDIVLFVARVLGGLSAGMAFPTTLALITALWSGPARTRSIALWSAIGGAIASLGPLAAGFLLQSFWWGSVFLITLPLALLALVMAVRLVPAHVNETTDPSTTSGHLVGGPGRRADPGDQLRSHPERDVAGARPLRDRAGGRGGVRDPPAASPQPAVRPEGRRPPGVLGRGLRGDHRLRDADGCGVHRAAVPPEHPRVLHARGRGVDPPGRGPDGGHRSEVREARRVPGCPITLLLGYLFCLLGFLTMLFLWKEGSSYLEVGLAYAFIGVGVGFAGTPASHSLTGSVPVDRAGMASGTADLQRDLGGALMTSILGALLASGYASAMAASIGASPEASTITAATQSHLQMSFAGAASVAKQYPKYADQITAAAETAFLEGDQLAYIAGIIAILIGAALVFFMFPRHDEEERLLAAYHAEDAGTRRVVSPASTRARARVDAGAAAGRGERASRRRGASGRSRRASRVPRSARRACPRRSPHLCRRPRKSSSRRSTPTAMLALVSVAIMPAIPATNATMTVERLMPVGG